MRISLWPIVSGAVMGPVLPVPNATRLGVALDGWVFLSHISAQGRARPGSILVFSDTAQLKGGSAIPGHSTELAVRLLQLEAAASNKKHRVFCK